LCALKAFKEAKICLKDSRPVNYSLENANKLAKKLEKQKKKIEKFSLLNQVIH